MIDSRALTGADITMYRALEARISYMSQDRPGLKIALMQVCRALVSCGRNREQLVCSSDNKK